MTLHEFLDFNYGSDGEAALGRMLENGADVQAAAGPQAETPLHVATRRRRAAAVDLLIDKGAEVDATTAGGKTAYAHAVRRGFGELVDLLAKRGAGTGLNDADRFAVAVSCRRLDEAATILENHPDVARTGNPEEDRLLADVAGRNEIEPVSFLIEAGADLAAPGLDCGTPLHQAAWFGQPDNARLLIDAGAPLDDFDSVHESSPLGWAVHGSRYSGGADQREENYLALVHMLLEAGSSLHYPDQPQSDAYRARLIKDAGPRVAEILRTARDSNPE